MMCKYSGLHRSKYSFARAFIKLKHIRQTASWPSFLFTMTFSLKKKAYTIQETIFFLLNFFSFLARFLMFFCWLFTNFLSNNLILFIFFLHSLSLVVMIVVFHKIGKNILSLFLCQKNEDWSSHISLEISLFFYLIAF